MQALREVSEETVATSACFRREGEGWRGESYDVEEAHQELRLVCSFCSEPLTSMQCEWFESLPVCWGQWED